MPITAADIPVELPPVAQVKLVLMAGIEARLRAIHGRHSKGLWTHTAAECLDVDQSEISRLRSRRYERFSLDQLVNWSDRIGVRLTIIAE